jgi:hypothetical protein
VTPEHVLKKQSINMLHSMTVASKHFRETFSPKVPREMPKSYLEAPTFINQKEDYVHPKLVCDLSKYEAVPLP